MSQRHQTDSRAIEDRQVKLLVVEDDQYLREEIVRVLNKRTNHKVTAAEDGEEALKIFDSDVFEVLITDVRMPGIDGIELLERLKQKSPQLVSIIITAFADEQATIRALKIGANDYIRKPFSIRDLVNAIDRQITVLKLREDADRSQRLLSGMVRCVRAGVLVLDDNSFVVAANKRFLEISGLKEEEFSLQSLSEFGEGNQAGNTIFKTIQELKNSNRMDVDRDLTIRQAGLPLSYRITATKIVNEQNRNLGVVILLNDVSELIQAQKLNAWKDLARTVAHEIKNPLTPIKLSAQQLLKVKEADEDIFRQQFDSAVNSIIKNADRLDSLAREFSRFGRLPKQDKNKIDLHVIIDEILKPLKHSDDFTKWNIQCIKGASPSSICGDKQSLVRMFENLINNAFEAMHAGGDLTISTQILTGNRIEVCVQDTGKGIDREMQENLFKPYVTSKSQGTGLGLVVVKEVVSQHDGTIAVENSERGGARFTLTFPLIA